MNSQTLFLVFGEDVNRPHCSLHLFREIAKKNPVIWFETAGLRNPSLSFRDLKRASQKLARLLKKRQKEEKGEIVVERVLTLPFSHYPLLDRFNQRQVKRKLQLLKSEFGKRDIVFVTTLPTHANYSKLYPFQKRVYYCVDDFRFWKGYNAQYLEQREKELLEVVDLTLTTSPWLTLSKQKSVYFPHGVERDHFQLPQKQSLNKELCVFGLLDERIDEELLFKLMQKLSDYTLKLIGDVRAPFTKLRLLKNVEWKGRVPYAQLKSAIWNADFFLLPYKISKLSETIEPLKLREYLATGRHVVASPFCDFGDVAGSLSIAQRLDDWVSIIRKPPPLKRAELKSWRERASHFLQLLEQAPPKAQ